MNSIYNNPNYTKKAFLDILKIIIIEKNLARKDINIQLKDWV